MIFFYLERFFKIVESYAMMFYVQVKIVSLNFHFTGAVWWNGENLEKTTNLLYASRFLTLGSARLGFKPRGREAL